MIVIVPVPCEICGKATRSKYSVCQRTPKCKREYGSRHSKASPEAHREANRRYYEANLEKVKERGRLWEEAHPDAVRESKRRYEEANRDVLNERRRRSYEANPEAFRERTRRYIEANSEKIRERGRRYREAERHDKLTYLLYSPGLNLHKIGETANLKRRLMSLRNACPDIEVVMTFPYDRTLERWLHKYFHTARIPRTEWFKGLTEIDVKNAVTAFEEAITEKEDARDGSRSGSDD